MLKDLPVAGRNAPCVSLGEWEAMMADSSRARAKAGQEQPRAQAARPLMPIRRYDVFAEYNKLKALKEGRPIDEAKGYGIWLAKVVAARRFGGAKPRDDRERGEQRKGTEAPPEPFRTIGGELQTDAVFDREVVDRMGADFYRTVFAPAIAGHFDRGERYEEIRDVVRREWRP